MNDIQLFDMGDSRIRFGITEDGTPYAVASDFAKALGYSGTDKATRLLDDDEKGHLNRVTPGGNQKVGVIYEAGLWRLIFRSNLPSAKALTKRVTDILREIRETGGFGVKKKTELELAREYVAALELAEEQRLAIAALEPKAREHDAFMAAGATAEYPIRTVAKSIGMGPNKILSAMRLLDLAYQKTVSHDSGWHLMQKCIDAGWGQERLTMWENGRGQSWVIYLTAKGVSRLYQILRENGYDVVWPEDLLDR